MYVQPGKKIKAVTIAKKLEKLFEKNKIKATPEESKTVSEELETINKLLIAGKGVRAQCIKEPRGNLDTGNHYYGIEYINNGDFERFWPAGNSQIAELFGMSEWNRDYSMPKWSFRSGAIGMSRKLDATDRFFNVLKAITGTYAQL